MHFINIPTWPFRRPRFLVDILSYLHWKAARVQERRFDNKHGIETSALESAYLDRVISHNKEFAVPYEAIQLDVFFDMLSALRRIIEIDANWHFVDLGSGKGRALAYASEVGFKKCTGVEFSAELCEIAQNNIASYRRISKRKSHFSIQCMDAVNFTFPDDDIVAFMYNPFSSEVMKPVIQNIRQFHEASGKDVVVLYRNPTCSDDLQRLGLTPVHSTRSFGIFRIVR